MMHFLHKADRKKIQTIAGITLLVAAITFSIFQSANYYQANLRIKQMGRSFQVAEDPADLQIWKLTHIPLKAPTGTIATEQPVIDSQQESTYQDIFSIAAEAITNDISIQQIAFEVDLDDEATISEFERETLSSIENFALFTESDQQISQAKLQERDNQILVIFKDINIQIPQGSITSLHVKALPVSGLEQDKNLRIQYSPAFTKAIKPNQTPAKIGADTGKNNNANTKDDLLSSDLIRIR